jgi:N12 class adenine-specific DNA methylase/GGDEF domain-containing protein/predicted RNA methylase
LPIIRRCANGIAKDADKRKRMAHVKKQVDAIRERIGQMAEKEQPPAETDKDFLNNEVDKIRRDIAAALYISGRPDTDWDAIARKAGIEVKKPEDPADPISLRPEYWQKVREAFDLGDEEAQGTIDELQQLDEAVADINDRFGGSAASGTTMPTGPTSTPGGTAPVGETPETEAATAADPAGDQGSAAAPALKELSDDAMIMAAEYSGIDPYAVPLSRFSEEEQNILRAAGIVQTLESESGEQYEAALLSELGKERDRRFQEKKAQREARKKAAASGEVTKQGVEAAKRRIERRSQQIAEERAKGELASDAYIKGLEKAIERDKKNIAEFEASLTKSDRRQDQRRTDDRGEDRRQEEERRLLDALRKEISDMSPEEMAEVIEILRTQALTDDLTGLGTKKAYLLSEKKALQSSIDVDSLAYINDNFGHKAGDKLLALVGQAFEGNEDAFHVSGDEFVLQGDDQAAIDTAIENAYAFLKENQIELIGPDGTVYDFEVGFSYGTAEDLETADEKLREDKARREREGIRGKRKEKPPSLRKRDQPGSDKDQRGDVPGDKPTDPAEISQLPIVSVSLDIPQKVFNRLSKELKANPDMLKPSGDWQVLTLSDQSEINFVIRELKDGGYALSLEGHREAGKYGIGTVASTMAKGKVTKTIRQAIKELRDRTAEPKTKVGENWPLGQGQNPAGRSFKTEAAAKAFITRWLQGNELAPGIETKTEPAEDGNGFVPVVFRATMGPGARGPVTETRPQGEPSAKVGDRVSYSAGGNATLRGTVTNVGEGGIAVKREGHASAVDTVPHGRYEVVEGEAAPATGHTPKPGYRSIGKNSSGLDIYENDAGARYYVEDGVLQHAPVAVMPSREGVQTASDSAQSLYDRGKTDFMTVDEIREQSDRGNHAIQMSVADLRKLTSTQADVLAKHGIKLYVSAGAAKRALDAIGPRKANEGISDYLKRLREYQKENPEYFEKDETATPTIDDEIAAMDMDDFDAMYDEAVAGVETPSEAEQPAPQFNIGDRVSPTAASGLSDKNAGKITHIRRDADGAEWIKTENTGNMHFAAKDWQAAEAQEQQAEADDQALTDILKDAASEGVKGVGESLTALYKLLGGNRIKSGPFSIDEDTYQAAKPHLEAALQHFREAGKSLKEFFQFIAKHFGDIGKALAKRYLADVKENAYNKDTEKGGENEPLPDNVEEETGGQGPGSTKGNEESGNTGQVPGDRGTGGRGPEVGPGGRGDAGVRGGGSRPGANAGSRLADTDYRITADDELGSGGAKTKFRNNLAAIKALKRIGDGVATVEDQKILAKYVGWGGIPQAFYRPDGSVASGWESEAKELQALLAPDEYAAARSTTQDAHYTSESIIRTMYRALARLGFTGGRILEPSVGTGNFLGLMPPAIKSNSSVTAVEIDPTTAAIAKHLYPQQNVTESGFENFSITENSFDAAIGNPPFGKKTLFDTEHRDLRTFSIHNYFFAKSLKAVRPGGIIAMVVSSSMMDKIDSTQREWLSERATLLGAIRLPNNAFKDNAGTEVTTDIIFLQKKGGQVGSAKSVVGSELKPGNKVRWNDYGDKFLEGTVVEVGEQYVRIQVSDTVYENKLLDQQFELLTGRRSSRGPGWTKTRAVSQKGIEYTVNEYFAKHPSHVLGEYGHNKLVNASFEDRLKGNRYKGVPGVTARAGQDTQALVSELIANMTEGVYRPWDNVASPEDQAKIVVSEPGFTQPFGCALSDDGQAVRRLPDRNGKMRFEPVLYSGKPLKGARLDRFKALLSLRDVVRRLMRAEVADDDAGMKKYRKALNTRYDSFVKKYGYISAAINKQVLAGDQTDYPLLRALETNYDPGVSAAVAKKTGKDQKAPSAGKADIFAKRMREPYRSPEKADSASDALGIVLREEGAVNIGRIARLYGATPDQAVKDLAGVVFQNPTTERYETRDHYLSGNVKKKLAEAKAAVANGASQFEENVTALEKVIPEDVGPGDIQFNIGATWIPDSVYMQFASEILGVRMGIQHLPGVGRWSVRGGIGGNEAFSTEYKSAGWLFDRLIQSRDISVYLRDSDGNRYFSKEDTIAANVKAAEIERRFSSWVIEDDARADDLVRRFNETVNTDVDGKFDGSHLLFPGMATINPDKPHADQLRPHQKNVVWRLIQKGKGLLDHVVGAGKTFATIATAMEMKRMGLIKKPMFAVPNHLIDQWGADFRNLYPGANVLVIDKKDFSAQKRQEFLGRIATGDWDAVVVAHSSFGFIQAPLDYQRRFMAEQIAEWDRAIEEMRRAENKKSRSVKQAEKTRDSLRAKLAELNEANRDAVVDFSQLGVDSLFVDEAHMYKNLYYVTSRQRVSGLGDQKGSKKAFDMFLKSRYLLEHNNDRGVFFMTGTPVSNTIAEMYTMMRYLSYDRMKEMGIRHFDQWANMFANVETVWEVDPSGTRYRQQAVFSEFINVPGMMSIYKDFADVISQQDLIDQAKARGEVWPIPNVKGGKPKMATVKRSGLQKIFMDYIVSRFDNMPEDPKEDNPLKATGEAMKAALDIRLINPDMPDFEGSKVNESVRNILDTYNRWNDRRGTQLVFCDLSVPKKTRGKRAKEITDLIAEVERLQKAVDNNTNPEKQDQLEADFEKAAAKLDRISYSERIAVESTFSVYDDIKQKLIAQGIPENEIAFIHDANTDDQKAALFKRVRRGDVRVLIGSTSKMGAGMNVQDRLVALHHLDAPWRPSDLEQREGRIIRQGNIFYKEALDAGDPSQFEVEITRYGTKETLDTRRWQIIERKAKVIGQLRAGAYEWGAGIEDAAGEAANSAEMKAAVSGNPLILEEVQLRQDINTLEAQERSYNNSRFRAQRTVRAAENLAENKIGYFEDIDAAAAKVEPRDDSLEGWNAEIDGAWPGEGYDTRTYKAEGLQKEPKPFRTNELPDDVQDAIHNAETIKQAEEYGKLFLDGPTAEIPTPKKWTKSETANPSAEAFLSGTNRERNAAGWLSNGDWAVLEEFAPPELIAEFDGAQKVTTGQGLDAAGKVAVEQKEATEPLAVVQAVAKKSYKLEGYKSTGDTKTFKSEYIQYLKSRLPAGSTLHISSLDGGIAVFAVDGKPAAIVGKWDHGDDKLNKYFETLAERPPFDFVEIPKADLPSRKAAVKKVVESRKKALRVRTANTRALKGAQQDFRDDLEKMVKSHHGTDESFVVKLRGVEFTFSRPFPNTDHFEFETDLESIDLFKKYLSFMVSSVDFGSMDNFSGTRFLALAHSLADTVENSSERLKEEINNSESYHNAQLEGAREVLDREFDKGPELEGKRERHAQVLVDLAAADAAGGQQGMRDFTPFTNPERYSPEDYADLDRIHGGDNPYGGIPMTEDRAAESRNDMLRHFIEAAQELFGEASITEAADYMGRTVDEVSSWIETKVNMEKPSNVYKNKAGWGWDQEEWDQQIDEKSREAVWKGDTDYTGKEQALSDPEVSARREALATAKTFQEAWDALKDLYLHKERTLDYPQQIGGHPQYQEYQPSESGMMGVTLDDIKDAFKGQAARFEDGKIKITMQDGNHLLIESVDQITPDGAAFLAAYGRKAEKAAGAYKSGTITIAKIGNKWTLRHEQFHALEDMGYVTARESKILAKQIRQLSKAGKFTPANPKDIGGKEDRAKYVTEQLKKRDAAGLAGRVIQKIADLIDGFVALFKKTPRSIIKGIESGKIMNRKGRAATGSAFYAQADDIRGLGWRPEDARNTQRSNTDKTYGKVAAYLDTQGTGGDRLDYGSGLGHGADILGARSYEPFPATGVKPDHSDPTKIDRKYDAIVSQHTLNVMPDDMRREAIRHIGSLLNKGGIAVLITRKESDVATVKTGDKLGAAEVYAGSGKRRSYQRGFTSNGLREETRRALGPGFKVEAIPARDLSTGNAQVRVSGHPAPPGGRHPDHGREGQRPDAQARADPPREKGPFVFR